MRSIHWRTNLSHNGRTAAFAVAVNDFLIRKTNLAGRAEIDRKLRFICKALFEKFQENPLRPTIVCRIGRIDFTRVIKRKSKHFQLIVKNAHIALSYLCGVFAGFYCIILRRQEHLPIERKWQKIWDDTHCFEAKDDFTKPKYYARGKHTIICPRGTTPVALPHTEYAQQNRSMPLTRACV